ncbi:MAG: enolase [Nitrososphaerota archaeon]
MREGGLRIEEIRLRIIFNHRGEKTVEAEVLVGGYMGRAAAPSGASRGSHEVPAYPERGPDALLGELPRLRGRLVGRDALDQRGLAEELEALGLRSGALAYALTMAAADAASKALGRPLYQLLSGGAQARLPIPLGNVIGGGKHASASRLDLQEVLVAPQGAQDMRRAIGLLFAAHERVGQELAKRDRCFTGGRGDEGAWTTSLGSREALEVARRAADRLKDELGEELLLGADFAGSSLWDPVRGRYVYAREGRSLTPEEQLNYVLELAEEYGLRYLEDPFHDEDWERFAALKRALPRALVCGDDLTATQPERLLRALREGAIGAAILKVNQVGYLYRALKFAELAQRHGLTLVASHRSGELPEAHLAHLAVATGSSFIKAGILGGERVAKLNELIRLEEAHGLALARVMA